MRPGRGTRRVNAHPNGAMPWGAFHRSLDRETRCAHQACASEHLRWPDVGAQHPPESRPQAARARRLAAMSATRIEHPSIDDRRIKGKQALERTAVSAPAGWLPADDRPDPVALLAEQDAT